LIGSAEGQNARNRFGLQLMNGRMGRLFLHQHERLSRHSNCSLGKTKKMAEALM
jgi:hypothetical protein